MSVGIIDTGVQADHCDLSANVVGGHNCTGTGPSHKFDDKNGHGTHVSGIVGTENNEIGVRGVAENPDLYGLNVFDNSGFAVWSYVVCAIDWCVSNSVEIMNLSLGGTDNSSVGDAIDEAYANGHLTVAAAGNESDSVGCNHNVIFPASHPRVISVSAMEGKDGPDELAEYSSTGDAPADYELDDGDTANDIDIMAPGGGDDNEDGDYTTAELIKSTWKDDSYAWAAGTSMASPHVTGVAATAWEKLGSDGPGVSDRDDIESALFSTADPITGDACLEGAGLVDASETVSTA